MRLFIGIELPEHIREAAAAAVEALRDSVRRAAPRALIRWLPADNLHVTVWFFGEVAEANVDPLVAALGGKPLDAGKFDLQLGGAGAFPPSGPPRALWLGLTAGGAALAAVHASLRGRLAPLGYQPESRPFAPHLTIGRAKDVHRGDAPAVRRILRDARIPPVSGEIDHATLFKSRTLPEGSQYEALLRVPLI